MLVKDHNYREAEEYAREQANRRQRPYYLLYRTDWGTFHVKCIDDWPKEPPYRRKKLEILETIHPAPAVNVRGGRRE